jgi:hypothetical protein
MCGGWCWSRPRPLLLSASAPPTTRPKLAPMPAVVPYEAAARVRSGPVRKLTVSNASEDYAPAAA